MKNRLRKSKPDSERQISHIFSLCVESRPEKKERNIKRDCLGGGTSRRRESRR
jgi:hypothetical protein